MARVSRIFPASVRLRGIAFYIAAHDAAGVVRALGVKRSPTLDGVAFTALDLGCFYRLVSCQVESFPRVVRK